MDLRLFIVENAKKGSVGSKGKTCIFLTTKVEAAEIPEQLVKV